MRLPFALSAAAIVAALPACSQACCPRPCERPVASPVPGAISPTKRHEDYMALLESKRVNGVHFEEATLDQVWTYLSTVTGFSFTFAPKALGAGYSDARVTLGPLEDVTVRQVLDLVTAPYGLRWHAEDHRVVRITLADAPSRAGG